MWGKCLVVIFVSCACLASATPFKRLGSRSYAPYGQLMLGGAGPQAHTHQILGRNAGDDFNIAGWDAKKDEGGVYDYGQFKRDLNWGAWKRGQGVSWGAWKRADKRPFKLRMIGGGKG